MEIYGVRLVGIDQTTGHKVLFTLVLVAVFVVLRTLFGLLVRLATRPGRLQLRFWVQQSASLITASILILGLASIWFGDSNHLATVFGLFTAGLGFALQKVITSIAGYFVILRGNMFQVGDRIVMGTVRGDVLAIGFIKSTVMEMGQPPPVKSDDPGIWVEGRQFTGRIVTVSNATIFEQPVYNYSRDFPLIWEELSLSFSYTADHARAEQILLACAERHSAALQGEAEAGVQRMLATYGMPNADLAPRLFYRLTDNWVELSVRFVAPTHGSRVVKDKMSREILKEFAASGISIAPTRYEIAGLPPVQVTQDRP